MNVVVERGTVDDVTLLRADSVTGRSAAAVTFRVGRFDESLPTAGVTHLVEHLAMAGHAKASYQHNAVVLGRFTTFFMESADPAHVRDFVTALCGGLVADDQSRLGQEKRILRTEAATRGGAGALGRSLVERYGARGPGLLGYEEFGLRRLSWAEVEDWRGRWFTAQNAVLWIVGPVPDGLRVELPGGPPPAAAELRPLELKLPAYWIGGAGGVAMSLVARRSAGLGATISILQERLTQVLRHDLGLSYEVQVTGEALDASSTHTWLAADALPDQMPAAAGTMLSTVESLAEGGCAPADLAWYVRQLREAHQAQGASAALMQHQAQNILTGRPLCGPDETLREASEVRPADVARITRELLGQAIVTTPVPVPAVMERMPRLPISSPAAITGESYQSTDRAVTLTAGPAGVMLSDSSGLRATVPAGAAAALIRWSDGKRVLVGQDGFSVQVDPRQWRRGEAAVRAMDAAVDPDLVVDIAEPGPAWGWPAQAGPASAGGQARASRLRAWPGLRLRVLLLVFILVLRGGLASSHENTAADIVLLVGVVLMIVVVASPWLWARSSRLRSSARRRRSG